MDMPMGSPRQPSLDCRRFVGGIVVHDDVDVETLGHMAVDLPEKIEKLAGSMPLVALSDDEAGGDIQGGEQGCRAVAGIVMGPPFGHTRHHREYGLLTV